jgi:glycosyltransferase involved in cell wall biosynthesis
MVAKGYQVSVYASSSHPYREVSFEGVQLIHCYDPENRIGTPGQFIYDLNCIRDARKRNFDIILQLGYTSSTIWSWLFPKHSIIVTNMDGLEWKRSKYNKPTQAFLRFAERWGVKYSDYLIADSKAIQSYLQQKHKAKSAFIPYGAIPFHPSNNDNNALKHYNVEPFQYDLLIARFEPENNLAVIIESYFKNPHSHLLVIGNHNNSFGKKLQERFSFPNIHFLGALYDLNTLNILRYFSRLYLHGHSVGGTNPSLLEAMACKALVVAHDNIFNRSVLGEDAFYFSNVCNLQKLIASNPDKRDHEQWLANNLKKIKEHYNWEKITNDLESLLLRWVQQKP